MRERESIIKSKSSEQIIATAETLRTPEEKAKKGLNLFQALAVVISKKWKTVSSDDRKVFEAMAKEEMKEYRKKLGAYQIGLAQKSSSSTTPEEDEEKQSSCDDSTLDMKGQAKDNQEQNTPGPSSVGATSVSTVPLYASATLIGLDPPILVGRARGLKEGAPSLSGMDLMTSAPDNPQTRLHASHNGVFSRYDALLRGSLLGTTNAPGSTVTPPAPGIDTASVLLLSQNPRTRLNDSLARQLALSTSTEKVKASLPHVGFQQRVAEMARGPAAWPQNLGMSLPTMGMNPSNLTTVNANPSVGVGSAPRLTNLFPQQALGNIQGALHGLPSYTREASLQPILLQQQQPHVSSRGLGSLVAAATAFGDVQGQLLSPVERVIDFSTTGLSNTRAIGQESRVDHFRL